MNSKDRTEAMEIYTLNLKLLQGGNQNNAARDGRNSTYTNSANVKQDHPRKIRLWHQSIYISKTLFPYEVSTRIKTMREVLSR
jgi:hypothetical protein